jgi:hypothetical protein
MPETTTCALSKESTRAAMCRGYKPVGVALHARPGPGLCATHCRCRSPAPACCCQPGAHCCVFARPEERSPHPPLRLSAETDSAASGLGLEGGRPRHHRDGAASTRRCSTGSPPLRCAVPRNPQPVARSLGSRGCALRRASSPHFPRRSERSCPMRRSASNQVWTQRPCRLPGRTPSLHRCLSTMHRLERRCSVAFGPAANATRATTDQAEA